MSSERQGLESQNKVLTWLGVGVLISIVSTNPTLYISIFLVILVSLFLLVVINV